MPDKAKDTYESSEVREARGIGITDAERDEFARELEAEEEKRFAETASDKKRKVQAELDRLNKRSKRPSTKKVKKPRKKLPKKTKKTKKTSKTKKKATRTSLAEGSSLRGISIRVLSDAMSFFSAGELPRLCSFRPDGAPRSFCTVLVFLGYRPRRSLDTLPLQWRATGTSKRVHWALAGTTAA